MAVSGCRLATLGSLALALAAPWVPTAAAQSGIQVTPDGKRTLVNKDVGAERWALSRNREDGSVTGNVFTAGGGDPQFVACTETGRSGDEVALRCEGAGRCRLTPCTGDEWLFIADVSLPASFFGAGTGDGQALEATTLARTAASRPAQVDQPAGVQVTRAGAVLVNKDVGGGQRWAITLNPDDNAVTGNVFFPDGTDPAFVWCRKKGFDDEQLFLECFGSDRCAETGCTPDDWSALFDVAIDEGFFAAPGQVTVEELDAALTSSLGSATAFDALILAFGKGYSFRQIASAGLGGRIRPPGDVVDRLDQIVPPEELPYGTEAESAGASGLGTTLGGTVVRVSPGAARERLLEEGANAEQARLTLLFMVNRGYSPRQILEAIEEDRIAFNPQAAGSSLYDAFVIVDDKGRQITPNPIGTSEVLLPPDLTTFECGNGIVDPGESCEDGVEITQSCTDFGFDGGPLTCVKRVCRYSTRDCRRCGNLIRDPGEECDGSDLRRQTCADLGFPAATVPGCTAECRIDDAPCRAAVEDGCPDGNLDPGEECDGTRFRDGRSCRDIGEGDLPTSVPCNMLACTYDRSVCPGATPPGCGNRVLEDDEQCDGGLQHARTCSEVDPRYESGSLGCNRASCTYDTSDCKEKEPEPEGRCGDGQLDPGEQCDGAEFRASGCTGVDSRFDGGTLRCRAEDCTYDLSGCDGCGDGVLEDDENCEAGMLSGFTCEILGFGPGTLRCNERCDFDTSGCGDRSLLCGNGIVNQGEDCDGRILPGIECRDADARFVGGTLACSNDCRFDTRACEEGVVCEEAICPDGTCTPFGADCCGNGEFCVPGSVCVGGGCCPTGLTQVCGSRCISPDTLCCGGRNVCVPGSKCCRDGCIPATAQCCPLGGACPAGSVCTEIAGVCCPSSAPKPCVADQSCRPVDVPCP